MDSGEQYYVDENSYKLKYKNFDINIYTIKKETREPERLLTYRLCEVFISIELNLSFKLYYKLGQRDNSQNILRGTGLDITTRARELELYDSEFNNLVDKVLKYENFDSGILYIDKGNLYLKLIRKFSSLYDLQMYKFNDELLEETIIPIINYILCKDKKTFFKDFESE